MSFLRLENEVAAGGDISGIDEVKGMGFIGQVNPNQDGGLFLLGIYRLI